MVKIGDTAFLFDHPQGVVTKINRYKNGNIKSIVYTSTVGCETESVTVRPKSLTEQQFPTTFKRLTNIEIDSILV